MSASGTWTVTVKTPMGDQVSTFDFTEEGPQLVGSMTNPESVEIYDGSADGDELTWKVDVQKPFPLKIQFNGTVSGDSISGQAKAGMFPPAPFSGERA